MPPKPICMPVPYTLCKLIWIFIMSIEYAVDLRYPRGACGFLHSIYIYIQFRLLDKLGHFDDFPLSQMPSLGFTPNSAPLIRCIVHCISISKPRLRHPILHRSAAGPLQNWKPHAKVDPFPSSYYNRLLSLVGFENFKKFFHFLLANYPLKAENDKHMVYCTIPVWYWYSAKNYKCVPHTPMHAPRINKNNGICTNKCQCMQW